MTSYYLDTSALIKRYVTETGSMWLEQLCAENEILIGEITRVEFGAAITAKAKRTKEISVDEADDAFDMFLRHLASEYEIVSLTPSLIESATGLARKHVLRAYDAVQLALAAHANNLLKQEKLSLTFVTSDKTLLQAAQAEELNAEDPQNHADLDPD